MGDINWQNVFFVTASIAMVLFTLFWLFMFVVFARVAKVITGIFLRLEYFKEKTKVGLLGFLLKILGKGVI